MHLTAVPRIRAGSSMCQHRRAWAALFRWFAGAVLIITALNPFQLSGCEAAFKSLRSRSTLLSLATTSVLESQRPASKAGLHPRKAKQTHAASTSTAAKKYLLFDVDPLEGVNMQLKALLSHVRWANSLGRTLVVPRVRLLPQHAHLPGGEQFVRWSLLYNLTVLRQLHPVVELDDFMTFNRTVAVALFPSAQAAAQAASSCVSPPLQVDPNLSSTLLGRKQGVAFNGVRLYVEQVVCSAPDAVLRRRNYHSLETVAVGHATGELEPRQALAIRRFVRFTEDIYEAARRFVSRTFNDEPFVALHWRQGDFIQLRAGQPGVLQSGDSLVSHARQLMAARRVRCVFLATDAKEGEELQLVMHELGPSRLALASIQRPRWAESPLQMHALAASIEIVICAMAADFLGTRTSSFSMSVVFERLAVFGLPEWAWGDMVGDTVVRLQEWPGNASVASSYGRRRTIPTWTSRNAKQM